MKRPLFLYTAFFLIALGAVTLASARIHAEDVNAAKYKHTISPAKLVMTLIRPEEPQPGTAILLISEATAINTCDTFSDISYEAHMEPPFMKIIIKDYMIDTSTRAQKQQHNCKPQAQKPSARIPLHRDTLLQQNIDKIEFTTGGHTDFYKIDISQSSIQLGPAFVSNTMAMKLQPAQTPHKKEPLTFWFYPERTVLLYAPDLPAGLSAEDAIEDFASAKGLTPLAKINPGFKNPLVRKGFYYYVDTKGTLPSYAFDKNGQRIGEINVDVKGYSLSGESTLTRQASVFSKTPGIYN